MTELRGDGGRRVRHDGSQWTTQEAEVPGIRGLAGLLFFAGMRRSVRRTCVLG